MATIAYTARSTLAGFSNTNGTYGSISGTAAGGSYTLDTEYTVPTHPPTFEQEMYNSDSSLNAAGDVYTGYKVTVSGVDYPVVQQGSAYYVYHNGAVVDGGGGTAATLNAFTLCFLKGTRLVTTKGEVAVEDLQIGDQLITKAAIGGTVPVKFVFTDTYQQPFIQKLESYPICITANALADNVPCRDLYVSPDHAIYFPEWNFFVEASILAVIVNDTSMYQVSTMPETFTYYHVLCNNQEIVLAENTPAETFIDNVTMETFDNYAEYAALYPQEHFMEELDIPRARSVRPLPRAFKQNLVERAKQLFPNLATQAA